LGSWWSSFLGLLPLSSLEGAMIHPKLRTISWQKQLEIKTQQENDIQTSGNPVGYIGKNYASRRNHRRKPGRKRAPGWSHHRPMRPGVGPRPRVVRSHRTPSPARFRFMIFHI
jgi:hypothetical protein